MAKPKGCGFPPLETIKQCIKVNRHGNALCWNKDGVLHVFRSMDAEETLAKYKELSKTLNPATTSLLFHARLATHGSHNVNNCHGFTHACARDGKTYAFMHNGIMHNVDVHNDMTDSECFFRELFVPAMENVSMDYAMKLTRAVGCGRNRYALIDNEGELYLHGGENGYFVETIPGVKGKIYFSNLNWKPICSYGTGFDPYRKSQSKPTAGSGSGLPCVGKRDGVGKKVVPTSSTDSLFPAFAEVVKEFAEFRSAGE